MKKLIQLFRDACGVLSLACFSLSVTAQTVPQLINYQGQLLDAAGSPMPTGDYDVEIRLFPVESGGAVVWGPQTFNGQSGTGLGPKVSVVQGHFNLIMGPKDTANRNLLDIVAANPNLFLEIKVGTGSPIAPRQQLLTAPYSLNAASAGNASKLMGYDWSPIFSNGDPVNGNLLVGVPANLTDARADINGRMRVRQGIFGTSGIWFSQNGVGDRAFVGMADNNRVGFYTVQGGWALTVDNATGATAVFELNLGPARLNGYDSSIPGLSLKSFYVSNVDNSYFDGAIWANGVRLTSDERLKQNIETIESPLEKIEAIRGVRFNFKDHTSRKDLNSHEPHLGVLAQDVQKVLPEAVSAAPDGYLAVDYGALVPVLVQAVKEQQKQIDALQAEVSTLKRGKQADINQ